MLLPFTTAICRRFRLWSAALAAGLGVAALTGCASPGVPRPPSLHLPEPVTGIVAERRGPGVVLHFAAPLKTTDGEGLRGPTLAQLCRSVSGGPCQPTASYPVPVNVAMGAKMEWTDVLPPELASGGPKLLAYRVQVLNARGRSAGYSEAALAAAGAAPPPVLQLSAGGERGGIVLHWLPAGESSADVLLRREALNAPAAAKPASTPPSTSPRKKGAAGALPLSATRGAQEESGVVLLRASDSEAQPDRGGTVDTTALPGTRYSYTAVRSRTVTLEGKPLELRGVASAPVEFTLRDVYPPAAPVGVAAADYPLEDGAGIAVDLVWRPNAEPDLLGYVVFRQRLGANADALNGGPPERLNGQPLPLPAFHDAAAGRAARLRYTVVAVDKSGNSSAPSQPVEITTAP